MNKTTIFKPVRKAVFPVAGLGTRFLPATKVMPKEMLTVGDRPLIQHVVEEAFDAGIREFIFVTSPGKKMLEDHFAHQPALETLLKQRGKIDLLPKLRDSDMRHGKLSTVYQPEPLGLGHAVWCARKLIGNEPFAVLLPDVLVKGPQPCLKQMMAVYKKRGGNVIAVEDVPRNDTGKYGIVDAGGKTGNILPVRGLVEKPVPAKAPSTLSIIGRYILQPEIFKHLGEFRTGVGGEIQLTDAMERLIGAGPFTAARFKGKSFDCGSKLGFVQANLAFALTDPEISSEIKKIIKGLA